MPSSQSVYETPDILACWEETFAPTLHLPDREGGLVAQFKPVKSLPIGMTLIKPAGFSIREYQSFGKEELAHFDALTKRHKRWDCLDITWNLGRSNIEGLWELKKRGYPLVHYPVPPAHIVDLKGGWEDYLNSISQNARKMVRRRIRRAEEFQPELFHFTDANEFLDILVPQHKAYWQKRSGYSFLMEPVQEEFLRHWVTTLLGKGQIQLSGFKLNGELTSIAAWIPSGDTLFYWISVFLEVQTEHNPWLVHMYLKMQDAISQGYQRLSLGAGDFFYKIEVENYQEPRYRTIFANPWSIPGRLYQKYSRFELYTGVHFQESDYNKVERK